MKLTLQQFETHLWGAANILRGKTAGQDYKNDVLSPMFYKRLCGQWECEADEAIAGLRRLEARVARLDRRVRTPAGARPAPARP